MLLLLCVEEMSLGQYASRLVFEASIRNFVFPYWMLQFLSCHKVIYMSSLLNYPCKDDLLTENPLRKFPLNYVYVREHMKPRYAKLKSNERRIYL